MQVPKNKTIHVGGRRYVEGDILPPHVLISHPEFMEAPAMSQKVAEKQPEPKTRSRRGRPRKRKIV